MSEPVIITDSDALTVTEGLETAFSGTGFTPYPEIPGPPFWPPAPGSARG